jgi:hypothetical protein
MRRGMAVLKSRRCTRFCSSTPVDRSSRRELVSTKDDGLVSSFSFLPRCIMCELSLPKTIVSCICKLPNSCCDHCTLELQKH